MTKRREFPYIWTTWLPNLLTGESSCEWAGWFKANHQKWAKPHSNFNQAEWLLNHTALLKKQRTIWKDKGYDVLVEGQNSFTLKGKTATLGGKPDLIAVRNNEAVIVDTKSGAEKPSHLIQVMIYIYAIPRALRQYRDLNITGRVVYQDNSVLVPSECETPEFPAMMGSAIKRLAAQTPPARVPSLYECRFCDILECPDRFDDGNTPQQSFTTDF